ncbi:hypothetical protein CMN24_01885 [Candidatus Saccharibacteria bacterium]|nr:hypothetical protein [Candidatus Saccharibacteria bacterium]
MNKAYFRAIFALSAAYLRRFFRDKVGLFFTFLFPLLFLFIFGYLNSGNQDLNFDIALVNQSDSSFAEQFETQLRDNEAFTVSEDTETLDAAKEAMGKGEVDTVIELPAGFGESNDQGQPTGSVIVYYDESSPQAGQTVAAVMEQALEGINTQLGQPEPPLTVTQESTATNELSAFDYVFSGLLGFTILSLGIFGLANQMPAEKKTGALRRLRASPITAGQLIFANMAYYMLIGIVSLVMMFVLAIFIFDFSMQGDWFQLAVWAIIGIILMFGFGLAIGGWAKNETQSAALTQLVALPLMFLSGTFFPRFLMPEWLQAITAYLPLTPVIDGFRMIMTEGANLIQLAPQLGLIAIWTVIIYVIAIRVFRWDP